MEMNGGFLVTKAKVLCLETGFSRRFSVKRILMRLMQPRAHSYVPWQHGWYFNQVTRTKRDEVITSPHYDAGKTGKSRADIAPV